MLDHCAGNHSQGSECETAGDAFDGCKFEACLANRGVDDTVHDGNQNDNEDRIEVRDDIVRDATKTHCCCLRDEVVGHLTISEPVPVP